IKPRIIAGLQAITAAADLPAGQVHYFHYPNPDDHAILLHLPDGNFVAYSGKCTHLSCAVYYEQPGSAEPNGKLVCPCHEGVFEATTGAPLSGPPQRSLPKIQLRQQGGTIYAIEETPQ